jgi:1-aminocyclopropane-1-carboxylate deaminase
VQLFDQLRPERIPIQPWERQEFGRQNLDVRVARADLLHPWVQGNKACKLMPFLQKALAEKVPVLVSMGSAWSNHLLALAFAGRELHMEAVFFLRGDRSEWQANPAVLQMEDWGVTTEPLSRSVFREWHQSVLVPEVVQARFPGSLWIPMGGSAAGALGETAHWFRTLQAKVQPDHLVLPVASGGTLAGALLGTDAHTQIWAIEVVRGDGSPEREVRQWLGGTPAPGLENVHWVPDPFGGYARSTPELLSFCRQVGTVERFPLEPVYSGKTFWNVSDLAQKEAFSPGSRILVVHTGGIFPWNLDISGS